MTDTPSDAAIEEALRRAGWSDRADIVAWVRNASNESGNRSILAHAKTLQEVNDALVGYWGGVAKIPDRFSPFIIPQPDPDEELAREVMDAIQGGYGMSAEQLLVAAFKRLRADGRLTDAK